MKRILSILLILFTIAGAADARTLKYQSSKQQQTEKKTYAKKLPKKKAVIVTGQNNHNWPVSCIAIKHILEDSGLFSVDLAVSPAKGGKMGNFNVMFDNYDVVVIDYNGDDWNLGMQEAFVEYAKNGGGIIFYHAADNAFPDWEEYNEMIGLGGWGDRNETAGPHVYWENGKLVNDYHPGNAGSHGKQHEYVLTRRSIHPVAWALPKEWKHTKDELYDSMRGPGNIRSLLYTAYSPKESGGSGCEEPLVFTVNYYNARIMHIMIGHAGPTIDDNPAMDDPNFKTLFIRSAQWCAGRIPDYRYRK